jgi:hypothetical protein
MSINYRLVNSSKGSSNVSVSGREFTFYYPCSLNNDCTNYEVTLSPGVYSIELWGGSGGHYPGHISLLHNPKNHNATDFSLKKSNIEYKELSSMGGAGGYTSGIITLSRKTKTYLAIGGSGNFSYNIKERDTNNCYLKENMLKGGYNGGGDASNFFESDSIYGVGSGGGATDLRIGTNDLFHRVLVAGGGGGSDDLFGTYRGSNDGTGGAGGNLIAQGYFLDGVYNSNQLATQESGHSFGNGASVTDKSGASDKAGAGGGWYGGYSSQNNNGGAGGGSSFALTKDSEINNEEIIVKDGYGVEKERGYYAFITKSDYTFEYVTMYSGIWEGNGKAVITLISTSQCIKTYNKVSNFLSFHIFIFTSLLS